MTCPEATDRIVDHLYGELDGDARRAFEAHLATCDACRREVEGMDRARRTARLALDGPLSAPAPAHIRRDVMAAAELALRQRVVPLAAPAPRDPGQRSGKIGPHAAREGFWSWLRRPWFLPAFATVSLLAIFFIARPAILDGPREALERGLAEPAPAPLLAPALDESVRQQASEGADDLALGEKAKAEAPREAAGGKGASLPAGESAPARLARPAAARGAGAGPGNPGPADGFGQPARRRLRQEEGLGRARSLRFAPPPPPAPEASAAEARAPVPAPPAAVASKRDLGAQREDRAAPADRTIGRAADQDTAADEADAVDYRIANRPQKPAAPSVSHDLSFGLDDRPRPARAPILVPPRASAGAPLEPEAAAPAAVATSAPAGRPEAKLASRASERAEPLEPLPALLERADRLFAEGKWQPAADAYRDLLRRFASDARAPEWQRRRARALASLRQAR